MRCIFLPAPGRVLNSLTILRVFLAVLFQVITQIFGGSPDQKRYDPRCPHGHRFQDNPGYIISFSYLTPFLIELYLIRLMGEKQRVHRESIQRAY